MKFPKSLANKKILCLASGGGQQGPILAGFGNPIEYIFIEDKLSRGIFEVENSIPYADIEHVDDEKVMVGND